MEKFGLACPLAFLASKPQRIKTNILDLNYDCYVHIFSYLTALEDKLNLARAHPQFREVFARDAPRRFVKINMRMLKCLSDWEYLLKLCGDCVLECELRHGRWDNNITQPFMCLLNTHCQNLRHLHLIFAHSDLKPPAEGDLNILQVLERKNLHSLSLIDAKAADVLQLHSFTELEALHIDGFDAELTNEDIVEQFKALSGLRRLSLRFVSRRQLPPLAVHCPLLEHLSLENFEGTLGDVGDFPRLRSLRLLWRLTIRVNSQLFRSLAKRYANRLEQLQLTKVNSEYVEHIVMLQSLKALTCYMWPATLLGYISKLEQLECLALQCTEPPAHMMQLVDVIAKCTKLQHLKLGKRWELEEWSSFLSALEDELRQQTSNGARGQLTLTLEQSTSKATQNQLSDTVNSQLLQLDWLGTACSLCTPDRHTKPTIPGLNWL
ncbi:PREDICTED: uncharacterized protein LOC108612617 [Drosophila arizonae]|uniref:Uncharacterized protein LOC108612617 n=1 Tax=Drosophila arizonae TaxID=7263 RepID=A0ABM1P1G9_DROAR|nr:PREDICTED: uncharacterized protein LOC108612617 [Drosophila arizonae]